MRKLTLFPIIGMLMVGAPVAHAAVIQAHANDVSAFVFGSDPNGTTVTLSAFRSGAQDSPVGGQVGGATGFISYEVSQCNLTTGICTTLRGVGNVPSSAISGGGQNVRVQIDTSKVSGFVNESCTVDTTVDPPSVTCVPAPGGVISVDFSKSPSGFSSSTSGTVKFSTATSRVTINGHSSSTDASASGTVLGTAIPTSAFAQIQTLRQTSITIETL